MLEEEDVLDSEDELLSSLGVVAPAEVTPGVVSATALAAEPAAGSALGSVVGSAPVVASDRVGGSATLSAAERRTLATSAATGTSEAWLLRVAPAKRRASALVLHISCTGGLGCWGFDCQDCDCLVKRCSYCCQSQYKSDRSGHLTIRTFILTILRFSIISNCPKNLRNRIYFLNQPTLRYDGVRERTDTTPTLSCTGPQLRFLNQPPY